MELKLAKTTFAPGETIEGQLLLTVNGPTKAKGVFVKLYAEQTVREYSVGDRRPHNEVRRVYEFPLQLDSEKEYAKTVQPLAYDFKIKIPEDAAKSSAPAQSGMPGLPNIGIGISIGGFPLGGTGGASPARWFVEGQLDIPLGIDIKNRVQISV